ncbi:hypothetical protein TSOC_011715, partial [Tetrabaena socialis]
TCSRLPRIPPVPGQDRQGGGRLLRGPARLLARPHRTAPQGRAQGRAGAQGRLSGGALPARRGRGAAAALAELGRAGQGAAAAGGGQRGRAERRPQGDGVLLLIHELRGA